MKKSYHSSAEPTADAKATWRRDVVILLPSESGSTCSRKMAIRFPPTVLPCSAGRIARSGGCLSAEIPVLGGGLVLVDRALPRRRGKRHSHRNVHQARLYRRLAAHQAGIELGEIRDSGERPGVGGREFVEQKRPGLVRQVLGGAVH